MHWFAAGVEELTITKLLPKIAQQLLFTSTFVLKTVLSTQWKDVQEEFFFLLNHLKDIGKKKKEKKGKALIIDNRRYTAGMETTEMENTDILFSTFESIWRWLDTGVGDEQAYHLGNHPLTNGLTIGDHHCVAQEEMRTG